MDYNAFTHIHRFKNITDDTLVTCVFVQNTDNEEDSETPDLLITTSDSVDKETLQMYFEQYTEQYELAKHGNNSWILKLYSQSGTIPELLWECVYYPLKSVIM